MFTITLPHEPKIKTISPNQAIIEIEACFPGYGLTLGNALRRVLLSSLPGAAITAFKIKNVPHEFTAIEDVEEDAIQIILNLKKIRFKSYTNEPITGKISAKGNKKIFARDIELPAEIEVVNKDALIATLTSSKAQFVAEVLIEKGIGYATAQDNKARRPLAADMINIDSIFSPIQKINFKIEDMRVGERTDYNRLLFDITTDGSLSPKEAFKYAVKLLINQFEVLLHEETSPSNQGTKIESTANLKYEASNAGQETQNSALLSSDIETLKINSRISRILKENKIITVDDLIKLGEEGLFKIHGVGEKAVKEIKRRLGRIGLALK